MISRVIREKIAAGVIVTTGALLFASWAFGDSNALTQRSAAEQPVAWVLDAVHQQPRMVATWAHQLVAGGGQRRGDTVLVALWADNVEGCSQVNSVSALLLNHSATPRVLAVSSPCIHPPAPPEPNR